MLSLSFLNIVIIILLDFLSRNPCIFAGVHFQSLDFWRRYVLDFLIVFASVLGLVNLVNWLKCEAGVLMV